MDTETIDIDLTAVQEARLMAIAKHHGLSVADLLLLDISRFYQRDVLQPSGTCNGLAYAEKKAH